MPYNYFPVNYQQNYPQAYPQNQQQNNGVVWVQGIEGAKAYPVVAGQAVLLMDSDSDCLYLKSADQSGMPSLRVFDYKERINTPQKAKNDDLSNFATKEDMLHYATKDDLKMAILELKNELEGKDNE